MNGPLLAGVVGLGAWCALDRTAFGQTLLAHPLIAASVAGALAGDSAAGLRAGIVLTAVSAPVLPVGERSLRDWTSAAVVLGAVAALCPSDAERGGALLAALAVAWAGGRFIHLVRRYAGRVLARRRGGDPATYLVGLESEHLRLTGLHGLRGVLVVGLAVTALETLLPVLVGGLAAPEHAALAALWKVAPLAALPLLLRFHVEPGRLWPYLLVGAAAGTLLLWTGVGSGFSAFDWNAR